MNIRRFVRSVLRRLPEDRTTLALHDSFLRSPVAAVPAAGALRVTVQCVEDAYYLGLFTHLCRALNRHMPTAFELLVPRSFNAIVGAHWKQFVVRVFPINRLYADQWVRAYGSISDRVAYRSASFRHPIGDIVDSWRSWRICRSLRGVEALERLDIGGVECGDLIIDSYLRFRPSPRVRLGDAFLVYLVWQAHRDVRRARRYFGSVRPALFLTSYTTYIQHGIAARVALQEGVRVISFGNLQQLGKLLAVDDSFHTRNPIRYRRDFKRLEQQHELLQEAQRQLEQRLSGGVDSATSYMAVSAYAQTRTDVPDVRDAVVVFLHDFYDSPHVYADLVFPDFWEWVCFTVETLQNAGIRFFLKPHPNQVALSDAVIGDLQQRYPDLDLIPSSITNRQLVDAGMACAVTVYGTIAHEMAYLGVPSIGCARHPHIAFDFCRTAKDRDGYAALLQESTRLPFDASGMRRQALEFYVMHNLNLSGDDVAVRDAMIMAWKVCLDPNADPYAATQTFEALAALPGFSAFAAQAMSGLSPARPGVKTAASALEQEAS